VVCSGTASCPLLTTVAPRIREGIGDELYPVKMPSRFTLTVDYRAPSRESLFLGAGWGIRDLRGPYLSAPEAEILIDNWALSATVPSILTITLSISGRATVNGVFVRENSAFGSAQCIVANDRRSLLTMPPLFVNPRGSSVIIKVLCLFSANTRVHAAPSTIDIIAIDGVELTR
jgi:hypothetical protein